MTQYDTSAKYLISLLLKLYYLTLTYVERTYKVITRAYISIKNAFFPGDSTIYFEYIMQYV